MTIPGFTGERSLQSGHTGRASAAAMSASLMSASRAPQSEVTPAAFNVTCYLNSYFRTFRRCTTLGNREAACAEVADGVAGSVCR
jgi:hypothetical protein